MHISILGTVLFCTALAGVVNYRAQFRHNILESYLRSSTGALGLSDDLSHARSEQHRELSVSISSGEDG